MTSYVENETSVVFSFSPEELVETLMIAALEEENCPYEAQVNVLITDNEGIRELNKEYREIDKATDVLSFPVLAYKSPSDFSEVELDQTAFDPDSGELILGDIILSADKIEEQAESYGHSQKREFAFLVVHSLLHLLGYDHMLEGEAAVMEEHQDAILQKVRIARE